MKNFDFLLNDFSDLSIEEQKAFLLKAFNLLSTDDFIEMKQQYDLQSVDRLNDMFGDLSKKDRKKFASAFFYRKDSITLTDEEFSSGLDEVFLRNKKRFELH